MMTSTLFGICMLSVVIKRDELQKWLGERNIGTLVHYPIPPHLQPAYQSLGYKIGDFPIAESIHQEVLSLPMGPTLSDEEVLAVVDGCNTFF